MKNYTSTTPEFNDTITIAEETDPGHADVINAAPKQLLENTLVLKSEVSTLNENIKNTGLFGNEEEGGAEGAQGRIDIMQNDINALKVPEISEQNTRENIESRESYNILFGKIKKWFSDLKSGAFAGIANNCTTTEEGSVLDARQGKILQEEMEEMRGEVNGAVDQLKKSVADGKALIASAITSKGVSTAASASFATMANNIKGISTTPIVSNYSTSPGDASFNRTLFTADKYGYVSIYTYAYTGSGSATCRVRINGTIQSNGVHAISAGSVVSVEGTNNGSYTRTMYSVVYVRV